MPTSAPPTGVRNRLLAALPTGLLSRILPRLRPVSLTVREVLVVADKPIESVYFVETGFVSLVATLEDGAQAEVGIVGREGVVGLPLALGVETTFEDAIVQVDGTALQIGAGAFRQILIDMPDLQNLLLRYSDAMRALAAQTAACNGRHGLEQRFARWLLMAHDRLERDDLLITQELLALMPVCLSSQHHCRCGRSAASRYHTLRARPYHRVGSRRARGGILRVLCYGQSAIWHVARGKLCLKCMRAYSTGVTAC